MTVSVIVPALNEAEYLGRCLSEIRATFDGEVIVVDGGSHDRTTVVAREFVSEVLTSPPGFALQCNRAVQKSRGDLLFFVAADCVVPPSWQEAVQEATASSYVVGGGFTLRLDDPAVIYRILEWGGNFRSRYLRVALADQGIFVRRSAFERAGGFDSGSLIPAARLCFQLQKQGEVVLRPETMLASTRKWRREGVFATTWRHHLTYLSFRRHEPFPR